MNVKKKSRSYFLRLKYTKRKVTTERRITVSGIETPRIIGSNGVLHVSSPLSASNMSSVSFGVGPQFPLFFNRSSTVTSAENESQ